MQTVRIHFLSRVVPLVLGMSIGFYQIALGLATRHLGILLAGVGMGILGWAWFVQPVVLGAPLRLVLRTSKNLSIVSPQLRRILFFSGLGTLWIGLILQLWFHI